MLLESLRASSMRESADYNIPTVSAVPEHPPISTMQQQQAEQMRVYWKVSISAFLAFRRYFFSSLTISLSQLIVHRRHAH
jgi:hypothetical protein